MEEKITDRIKNRFWKRVQKSAEPDACWLYISKSKQKSHIFFITSNHCRSEYYATRIAKFISGCEVKGKLVYRTCDTANCVNPDHLKVGDHNDVAHMNKEKGIMPGPKKKQIEVRPVSFVVRFD